MANGRREQGPPVEGDEADGNGPLRRRLLGYGGLAALLGIAGIGAGLTALGGDDGNDDRPEPTSTPEPPGTAMPTPADSDLLALVERYAPDLYFGRRERWFPTDPRPYASEVDGRTVVDGFDALAGYTRAFREQQRPPNPAVFYNVAPVDESVVSLQYWMYSVFDQFTVNFHWHDWELLQVFVDRQTEAAILLSASAHARPIPNNEFLDPDLGPGDHPVVLVEVGSHSSTTDVNGNRPSFERFGTGALAPDVSNGFLGPLDGLSDQPFAYGLPRDEGARLPYVLPELDGVPLPEHPDLPDVDGADFVDEDVTVRSWRDLARPPANLPPREPGTVLTAPDSSTDGDASYELFPLSEAAALIDGFTGPQLSFEFAIPGFLEAQFADHITTAGIPWEDPRSTDPLGDVTDPTHRRTIDGAEPAGLSNHVAGAVSVLLGRSDGDVDAVEEADRTGIDPFVPVSRFPLQIEAVCLLRSDPVASVTSGGVFRFLHVEPGTHELVINGPGIAPYAERFEHGGGSIRPGTGGRVTLVRNEDAVLLRADRRDATGISRVRIVETLAGPVYDARPVEAGRFAVWVHREGDYTVEIADDDGVGGIVRVDPGELDGEPVGPIETGKVALLRNLAEYLAESAIVARELATSQGTDGERTVPLEFEAASGEALEAADVAARGDPALANELLVGVVDRLVALRQRLADAVGYTAAARSLLRYRAATGIDRAEVAYGTPVVE